MLDDKTFIDWNFSEIWEIEKGNTLPYLKGLLIPESVKQENYEYISIEGAGTEENPYLIKEAQQLKLINTLLNAHYKLANDIDMQNITHEIIGQTQTTAFTGRFDGNGNKISNLNIESDNQYVGFFGYIKNGTIKNLKLENINVTDENDTYARSMGSLAGYIDTGTIENITIQGNNNITNKVTVTNMDIGGLVGSSIGQATYQNIDISNIEITGDATGNLNEGGLIGYVINADTKIENINVKENGKIQSGENAKYNYVGGIIGSQTGSLITNSHAKIEIIVKNKQSTSTSYVGGLIGRVKNAEHSTSYVMQSYFNVDNSYTNVNIINESIGTSYIGGVIGSQEGNFGNTTKKITTSLLKKVYSTGKIKIGTGFDYIGGLVGNADVAGISDAYSTVDIEGTNENTSTAIGGLVGNANSTGITNTYAIGKLTENVSTSYIGGLVGKTGVTGASQIASTIDSSYWSTEISGEKAGDSNLGTKRDMQAMQKKENYQNWDFDKSWAMMVYPYLKEMPIAETFVPEIDAQGSGLQYDPFIITTLEELKIIAPYPVYSKLGNDIDASSAGIMDTLLGEFSGVLEGDNHTIKNVTIKSYDDYVGVIKQNNGTIKNLKLENINIESNYTGETAYLGGVCAYNNGTLINLQVDGIIKNTGRITNLYMGGISGYNNSSIKMAYNNTNISSASSENLYIGGIAGKSVAKIYNSYSKGNISLNATNACAGGIVGENNGIIKNTYAIGTIDRTIEKEQTGGIVGKNNLGVIVSSYWNIPNVIEHADSGNLQTLEELKRQDTFKNWNFTDLWYIEEGKNTPVLQNKLYNDENYNNAEEYENDGFWEWHTRETEGDMAYNGTHIAIKPGESINFYGYGVTSYKDYLYKYYSNAGEKKFLFTIDETKANYHTLDGAGFMFNASKKDDLLSGYVLLIREKDICLYRLDNVNATTFEIGSNATVQTYAGAPIANVAKTSNTIHQLIVKTSPTNVIVIDNNEEIMNVELDYSKHVGEDFGLLASYAQHACDLLSEIQFQEFVMEVKDYTVPVLKTDALGNPLSGAKFQVKNVDGETIKEGTTNTNGIYRIQGLQEGIYTLEEIEAPVKYAFKNNTITFKVTGDGKVLNIDTEEEMEIKIINEPLKFEVKVEDIKKNPIHGSKVKVYDEEGNEVIGSDGQPIVVTTGENGTATVTDIEAGTYTFKQTEVSSEYILNNTTYTVTIAKDGTVTYDDAKGIIVNKKYGNITIQKYKTDTTIGVEGAVIEVKDAEGNGERLTTNANGTITFKAFPGTYTYKEVIAPEGYILNDTEHTFSVADDGTVTYDSTKGIIYNEIQKVTMKDSFTITKKRAGTDIALSGAVIGVFNSDNKEVLRETTGEDGTITVSGLEVGSYYYKEISAPAGYVLNNTEYHFTVENDGSVTLVDNEARIIYNNRVTMGAEHNFTITKKKVGTDMALSGAVIGVFNSDNEEVLRATTGEDGTITVSGLEVGSYYYKEIEAPAGYVLNNTQYNFTVNNDGSVTLADGTTNIIENTRVTMSAEHNFTITKKRAGTDIALSGAVIGVFNSDNEEVLRETTGEDGTITVSGLEVGSYYYKEIEAPAGYVLNNTEYHFTVENDGSVTLVDNEARIIYNNRVTMGAEHNFTITKKRVGTDIVLSGAVIGIFDADGNKISEQTTGEDGTITVSGLEVGSYYYKEIEAPAGYVLNNTQYNFTVNNDGSVTLEEGTTKVIENTRVTMGAEHNFTITKKRAGTDIALSGAVIGVFNSDNEEVLRATTGEDGRITVSGLEVGSYYYKEIEAPAGYVLNNTQYNFTVNNDGSVTLADGTTNIIENTRVTMSAEHNFTITKKRAGTDIALSGAVIGVFNSDNEEVLRATTGEDGTITVSGLEVGSYYYKEISAPAGYVPNNTQYNFTVNNDGSVTLEDGTTKVIENTRVTMGAEHNFTITKKRAGTDIALSGAVIGVFNSDNEEVLRATTGEDGTITISGLEVGSYYYKEISAPAGYVLNNTEYHFTVTDEGTVTFAENANRIIYNDREIVYGDVTIKKYAAGIEIPLAGAVIGIYREDGTAMVDKSGNPVQITTNAEGTITFKITAGTYKYKEISAPAGYVLDDTEHTFTVSEEGVVTFDSANGIIYNSRVTMRDGLIITKYKTGTTIGLPGAVIGVFDESGKELARQTTNTNGQVTFTGLEVGSYYYKEISAPAGYVLNNTEYHFTVENDGTVKAIGETNFIIYNNRVTMTDGLTITKYRTETTNPIAGAVIGVFDAENKEVRRATTNEEGTVTFSGLEVGNYYYKEISAPAGYILNNIQYHFTVENNGSITLGEGTTKVIYNDRVKAEHTIITKYVTGTQTPVAGAVIGLFDESGNKLTEQTTNENGQVDFVGLEAGTYKYKEITAPAGYVLNNTMYTFTITEEGVVTFDSANGIIYNTKVTMKEALTITKKKTETEITVAGAVIGVFDSDNKEVRRATTNEEGTVTFSGLEVGSYYYKEISAPAGYILNNREYHFTVENDGNVTLAKGSTKVIYNDRVTKDHIIITKYITETTTPVSGAVIGLFDESGNKLTEQTTNANGQVDFVGLEPGTYKYKELTAPEGYVLNETMYTFTIKEEGEVTFDSANGIIYNSRVTMKEDLIIAKYRTGTQTPLAGAVIGIFNESGKEIARQTTSEAGTVTFSGLEVGNYYYKEISAPAGYILNNIQYHFTVENNGSITLGEGSTKVIYNDRVKAEHTIITKYVTGTKTPVSGAVIGLFDESGNKLTEQTTNANGQVDFVGLEPGTYKYKELTAPEGYVLNNTIYTFTITEEGVVTFDSSNGIIYNNKKEETPEIKYGTVTIKKYEKDTIKGLAGATIGIYDNNGNAIVNKDGNAVQFITNANGEITFKAKPGTYQYKELVAPEGYVLNNTIYTLTVAEDGTVTFDSANGIIYNKKEEKPDIPQEPEKPEVIYGEVTITKYEEGTQTPVAGAIIGIYDEQNNETKITTNSNGTIKFKAKPGAYRYQELEAPEGYILNNTIYTFTVAEDGTVIFDSANGIIYNKKEESNKPEVPDTPDVPDKPTEPDKPVTPDVPKDNVIVPSDNTTIKNTTNQPVENIASGKLPQTGETEGVIVITIVLAIVGIYFGIKIREKQ